MPLSLIVCDGAANATVARLATKRYIGCILLAVLMQLKLNRHFALKISVQQSKAEQSNHDSSDNRCLGDMKM